MLSHLVGRFPPYATAPPFLLWRGPTPAVSHIQVRPSEFCDAVRIESSEGEASSNVAIPAAARWRSYSEHCLRVCMMAEVVYVRKPPAPGYLQACHGDHDTGLHPWRNRRNPNPDAASSGHSAPASAPQRPWRQETLSAPWLHLNRSWILEG